MLESPDFFFHPGPSDPESIPQLSQARLEEDQDAPQSKKDHKNKFINKIKQLQTGEGLGHQVQYPSIVETAPSERPSTRKERNKLAAQGSRDRKKLYMKLVQENIEKLQREIQAMNREIDNTKEEIFSMQMSQTQVLIG